MNSEPGSLARGFNRLAPAYDLLASVFSFGSIHRAEKSGLSALPALLTASGRAMVLGGGTGRFAACLLREVPFDRIDSIDISSAMNERARARLRGLQASTRFRFFNEPVQDWLTKQSSAGPPYDLVVANYFFDCLTPADFHHAMKQITQLVPIGGLLYYSDFRIEEGRPILGLVQSAIVRFLYGFFHLTTGLPTASLPPVHPVMNEMGWSCVHQRFFALRTLECAIFRRTSA